MSWIFGGKKVDPKEQVKQWRLTLKREMRKMDQQVRKIDSEGAKVKAEIKKAAKQGQMEGAKILARELVHSQKAKERILMTKANINSMEMQLSSQMATMRVAGAMEKSADMMKTMNSLINDRECAATMRELAQEMQQASIIDELMQEAFEDMEPAELEDESSAEVEKILAEITGEQVAAMEHAPTRKPAAKAHPAAEVKEEEEEEDDEEMAAMQARIAALRTA